MREICQVIEGISGDGGDLSEVPDVQAVNATIIDKIASLEHEVSNLVESQSAVVLEPLTQSQRQKINLLVSHDDSSDIVVAFAFEMSAEN